MGQVIKCQYLVRVSSELDLSGPFVLRRAVQGRDPVRHPLRRPRPARGEPGRRLSVHRGRRRRRRGHHLQVGIDTLGI